MAFFAVMSNLCLITGGTCGRAIFPSHLARQIGDIEQKSNASFKLNFRRYSFPICPGNFAMSSRFSFTFSPIFFFFFQTRSLERSHLLFHSRFIPYTSQFALCPPGQCAQRKAIPRRNLIKTIKLWKEATAEH